MTRRETLARAYPLHFQRIVEIIYEWNKMCDDALIQHWFNAPANHTTASSVLCSAFSFSSTEEGYEYWSALCWGGLKE